jgi:hypothetical protein
MISTLYAFSHLTETVKWRMAEYGSLATVPVRHRSELRDKLLVWEFAVHHMAQNFLSRLLRIRSFKGVDVVQYLDDRVRNLVGEMTGEPCGHGVLDPLPAH